MANIWAGLLDSEQEEERARREYKAAKLSLQTTISEKSHLYFAFGLITLICYPFGVYGPEWAKWILLILIFFLFNGEFVLIGAIRRIHMFEASSVDRAHLQMAVVALLSLAYTFVGLWRGWFVPWLPLIVAVVINSLHGAGFAPRKSSNRMAGDMKDSVPIAPQVQAQVPYQALVLEIVDSAMAIDVFDGEAFNNLPINRLEATMSSLWMITRVFYGLKDDRCFDMASKCAVHAVLEMVSGEYSEQEFSRMVIPTYKRRIDQYNEMFILGPSEAAQAPLMRVCKQIVENVCGEEEAHIAQVMSVMLVGWETISMIGKEILTLENAGQIDWTPSGD